MKFRKKKSKIPAKLDKRKKSPFFPINSIVNVTLSKKQIKLFNFHFSTRKKFNAIILSSSLPSKNGQGQIVKIPTLNLINWIPHKNISHKKN